MERIKVGVLGASGLVGQRIVGLLADHPWFQVAALGGSERAAGRVYGELWDGASTLPPALAALRVGPTAPGAFAGCALVFSALPADAARTVEPAFADAGIGVVSNASAFRMEADVPLIIPEVNGDHLALIARQRRERGWRGFLVTNPNCSTIHLTLALAPLHQAFGLATVQVTTLQALSGAGRHGVAALDMIDNVIPYIGGEEDKLEHEPQKLLGTLTEAGIAPAPFLVSAQCTRVPTTHGHLEMVAVQLQHPASLDAIRATWEDWRPLA